MQQQLQQSFTGWVIVNIGHPGSGRKMVYDDTFHYTRKGAINLFITGTSKPWRHWKAKYNCRAVRATQTITANMPG